MRPDFDFLRRLGSLIQQLGGGSWQGEAAYVSLVDDRTFNSSRERAPMAADFRTRAAPAAGTHNVFIYDGLDAGGPSSACLVSMERFIAESAGNTAGFAVGIADPASLTFATGPTQGPPLYSDVDPEVAPRLRVATIATANIPAVGTAGWMTVTTPFLWSVAGSHSAKWLPRLPFRAPAAAFIVICLDAAQTTTCITQWQAMRI